MDKTLRSQELPASHVRPTVPLPNNPAQHFVLENYSSIKRYWDLLDGLDKHLDVRLPKRTPMELCRREIFGFTRLRAASLLDTNLLARWFGKHIFESTDFDDDELNAEKNSDEQFLDIGAMDVVSLHIATEFLEGNREKLLQVLNENYALVWKFSLAFTKRRELCLKTEANFEALENAIKKLPTDWPLRAKRLGGGEYRALIERLAQGPM